MIKVSVLTYPSNNLFCMSYIILREEFRFSSEMFNSGVSVHATQSYDFTSFIAYVRRCDRMYGPGGGGLWKHEYSPELCL